mgnify:CR=1 FL=1
MCKFRFGERAAVRNSEPASQAVSKSSFRPASSNPSPFVVPEYPAQSDSAEYFGLVLGRIVSRQAVPAQSLPQLLMRSLALAILEVTSHKVIQMPQPNLQELIQSLRHDCREHFVPVGLKQIDQLVSE